jgi:hypothetical protein
MKTNSWLAVVAIAAGTFLLRFSLVNGEEGNWVPVHLPFPGAGQVITDDFQLTSGGQFALHVVTPASAAEKASLDLERPHVAGHLEVIVTGPRHFRTRQVATRFDGSATIDSNIYTADQYLKLPVGGDYKLELRSDAQTDLFSQRGAMIQLTRHEPVGPELLYPIAKWTAYTCLIVASIMTLAVGYQNHNVQRNPGLRSNGTLPSEGP